MENVVDNRKNGCCRKDNHPKPEENVDFLIDDIDGQNTNSIVRLDRSRGTVLEEGAFRDSRKYSSHRIDTFFGIGLKETHHFNPISTAEENITKYTLTKYKKKINKDILLFYDRAIFLIFFFC